MRSSELADELGIEDIAQSPQWQERGGCGERC